MPNACGILRYAIKAGMSLETIYEYTAIDPWFLDHLFELVEIEEELRAAGTLVRLEHDRFTPSQAKWFLRSSARDI